MPRLDLAIDRLNTTVGHAAAWCALAMVLTQLLVVLLRYVFGVGFIWMQESVVYLHATMFMLGAGYTLLRDGHVRVDIFYGAGDARRKAWVNLLGCLGLLLPFTIVCWSASWPYVVASWQVFEGSKETSGIQAVFLLKTLLLAFSALVFLQGVALALKSALILTGQIAAETPDDG